MGKRKGFERRRGKMKIRGKIQHGKCLFIFLFSLTGKPKERERRIQLRKIEKWYCRVREIKSKTFKSF